MPGTKYNSSASIKIVFKNLHYNEVNISKVIISKLFSINMSYNIATLLYFRQFREQELYMCIYIYIDTHVTAHVEK